YRCCRRYREQLHRRRCRERGRGLSKRMHSKQPAYPERELLSGFVYSFFLLQRNLTRTSHQQTHVLIETLRKSFRGRTTRNFKLNCFCQKMGLLTVKDGTKRH